jgi:hypothetical protein
MTSPKKIHQDTSKNNNQWWKMVLKDELLVATSNALDLNAVLLHINLILLHTRNLYEVIC